MHLTCRLTIVCRPSRPGSFSFLASLQPRRLPCRNRPFTSIHAKLASRASQRRLSGQVIQNQEDFDRYWTDNVRVGKMPKGIKWGSEQVVAIHLGHRGSAGYSAYVYRMTVQNGSVLVDWVERIPSSKGIIARETSPYVLVRMPLTRDKVSYRKWVQDPAHPLAAIDAYPVMRYLTGEHSLIKEEVTTIVDDVDQLKALWLTAFGKHTPLPRKDFNFLKFRMAVIMFGYRNPTGGHPVNIDRLAVNRTA